MKVVPSRAARRLVVAVTVTVTATFAILLPALPSAAITGTNPVVVVLCNFKNQTQQPNPPSYYLDMFSDQGSGQLGAFDYWRDVSYGNLSVSGTVVKGWYTLDLTRDEWEGFGGGGDPNRIRKWRLCAEAAKPDVDYTKYAGVVTVFPNAYGTLASAVSASDTTLTLQATTGAAANFPTPPFNASLSDGTTAEAVRVTAISGATFTVQRGQAGTMAAAFPAGTTLAVGGDLFGFNPRAETLGGTTFTLGGMVMMHDHPLTLAVHEEAHLFGFNHSRAVSQWPTNEYSDCYDIGSAMSCVYTFAAGTTFGSAATGTQKGPGLNSLQVDSQGWLPAARKATFDNPADPSTCRQTTYAMAALNHPEKSGFQQVRIPAPGSFPVANSATINTDSYTVELRSKTGWDRGIPNDAFVLHLKGTDGASYLVDRDRAGLPVGTFGEPALRPGSPAIAGRIYVDTTANTYVAVNSIDAPNATGVVTVGNCRINASLTYTGATSATYHRQATLSGTLVVAGTTAPVPNTNVTFTLGSQSCTAATNLDGHASCTITIQDPSGAYTVNAAFAGNAAYNPASASAAFTIERAPTTLTYTGPTVVLQGASGATLSAVLLEDGATPVPPDPAGQTVTLGIGGQTCTGVVQVGGAVSCHLAFNGALGEQPLSATFAGDAYYLPSSDTVKTAIVFALPERGAFVLGDLTVSAATPSTQVTWWGDAWWSRNSLTGGTAPLSFKGFAGAVTTLPTGTPVSVCGTAFTTLPGNSTPPTKDVPSYMGVIVADSVTKSGNSIEGSWGKIVVVKTDPGFAPNAGHPGTGTVVATYCE